MSSWSRVAALFAALLVTTACTSTSSVPDTAETERIAAAHRLLRSYVDLLGQVAKARSPEVLAEPIRQLVVDAAGLHVQGKITDEFYERFACVGAVTIGLIEQDPTPGAIRAAERELEALAKSVGAEKAVALGDGLAGIAPLLREEIIRLHLLADPSAERSDIERQYFPASP